MYVVHRSVSIHPIREQFMSFSSLPRPRLVKGEYILSARDLPILGYRKDGRPIYPIMGAEDNPPSPSNDPPKSDDPPKNDQPKGPVEATDPETGAALGFPKDTAVADMKPEQQAAYWRNESKKQQKRVPANLTEMQQKAQQWDEFQRSQQTPSEQAIQKAREEAAAATRKEVAGDSALTNLRVILQTRGKKPDEADALVEYVNPERFITQDGKVDTAKVMAYADSIVPSGSGGGGGGLPGQGRHDQTAADKAAAGKSEAERRGYKPAGSTSSLLPKTS